MMVVRHTLTIFFLIAALSSGISAQEVSRANQKQSAEIDGDIRKLLEVTGSGKIAEQMFDQMFDSLKSSAKNVPENVWQEIYAEFKQVFNSEKLAEMLTPVYKKYLTQNEVKELIAFYESPLGKKVISVMPKILQESFAIGQEHGIEILKRLRERLKQKGYNTTAE